MASILKEDLTSHNANVKSDEVERLVSPSLPNENAEVALNSPISA